MKYFIDAEFIDCEQVIDLISLGVVAEDGREFVAQLFPVSGDARWARELHRAASRLLL